MVSAAVSGFGSGNVIKMDGTSNSVKESKSANDFMKMMATSISGNARKQNETTDVTSMADSSSKVKMNDEVNAKEDLNADTSDNVKKTENTSECSERVEDKPKENVKDKISDAVNKIKDKIKEELGITDEELADAMAALSMTVADLLSVEKVTELVTKLEGASSSLDLITDGSFYATFNNIIATVNEQSKLIAGMTGVEASDVCEMAKEAGFDVSLSGFEKNVTFTNAKETEKTADEPVMMDSKDITAADVIAAKTVVTKADESGDFNQSNNSGLESKSEAESKLDVTQFGNNLAAGITDAFDSVSVDTGITVNGTDILRQVIEQVRVTATQQLQSIEVILNPENLGTVHVTVSAKEGAVTAQLTATNEQVKAALENQVIQLKEQFNNQGIKVDAVEVTVQSHSFEANDNLNDNSANQNSQGRKNVRRLDLSSLEDLDDSDLSLDEIRAKDSLVNGDSSVVYQA